MLVGRITRAVGLKGEVEIFPVTDYAHRFDAGAVLLVGNAHTPRTIRSRRAHGERTIIAFDEVTDRNGADALVGVELYIAGDQARVLDDDEYWDHDLLGCVVVTVGGDPVGEVVDVLHQPAGEVLQVRGPEREHLIPLIRDVVKRVVPGQRIEIDPIPGLLDDA